MARMARIRKDGFPIREIRAIRGKNSSRQWLSDQGTLEFAAEQVNYPVLVNV
jgi:hypothetical protein